VTTPAGQCHSDTWPGCTFHSRPFAWHQTLRDCTSLSDRVNCGHPVVVADLWLVSWWRWFVCVREKVRHGKKW
jgi:hypothetical protein